MTEGSSDEIRAYLSGLSTDQLVDRLLAVAQRDEATETALRAEAAAAAGTFDLAAFKKELTARIRVPGFVDWRGARRYADRVDGLLDVLDSLIAAGRADDVVVLAEHVMARLETAANRIDDSSGYVGDVVARAGAIHLRACEQGEPDVRKLGARLVDLALKHDIEWLLEAPERYASVLGDEGLAAYRRRLEPEWEALPALGPERSTMFRSSYEPRRFAVTMLRTSLARAGGSVDELVSVLGHDLSTPHDFCRIAEELESAGREREAVAWLERGLASFPPAADVRLREMLTTAYLRDGQVEDAVALAERAFESEPRAGTYRELRDAASGLPGWPRRRQQALERLRDAGGRSGRSEVVAAQLDEGAAKDAWEDAMEGGCRADLWLRLAEARRADHPDDALRVYRMQLESALEHAHERSYEEVVRLLREIRVTLEPHGREQEFADEVDRIREEYRRRPKMVGMLAAEGW